MLGYRRPVSNRMPSERTEDQLAGLFLDELSDDHLDAMMEMGDPDTDALDVLANAASYGLSSPVHNVFVVGSDILDGRSPKAARSPAKKSRTKLMQVVPRSYPRKDPSTPFACDMCEFRGKTRLALKNHVDEEHHESNNTSFLKSKSVQNVDKMYLCNYCNYSTVHRSALRVHTKTHTGEKPFGCKQCTFKSATMRRMKEHVMSHLGEKPFLCDQCGYGTTRKDHLRVHKLTHTGEKPFACEYCPYKSHTIAKLNVHRRAHTGEKPYACEFCDYRATRKDYLDSHMRQHTGAPNKTPRARVRKQRQEPGSPSQFI